MSLNKKIIYMRTITDVLEDVRNHQVDVWDAYKEIDHMQKSRDKEKEDDFRIRSRAVELALKDLEMKGDGHKDVITHASNIYDFLTGPVV